MVFTTLFAVTLAAGVPATTDAVAATAPDARYEAFLGCWGIETDRIPGRAATSRLCVLPREGGGVRLLTVSEGMVVSDEALIPDDVVRPTTTPGCRGTERAVWATTFTGIFRSADLACGTDTASRAVASLSFLRTDGAWIDVQVVGTGEQSGIRVRRYRLAEDQSLPTDAGAGARSPRLLPASRVPGWTVANVIEATATLPAEGVEAIVTELDRPIELKKKQLLALADGGVNERVIDLLVGLTYPEKFVVRRAGGGGGAGDFGVWTSPCVSMDVSQPGPCLSMGWESLGLWDFGAYRYPGYFGMYGYGGYYGYFYGPLGGYYPPYYGGGVATGPSVTPGRPVRPGVVINGQGYTQVTVRQPATHVAGSGARGGGDMSGGGTNSNAGVSSQGYSSGGGGGGGDRTAVARPPE